MAKRDFPKVSPLYQYLHNDYIQVVAGDVDMALGGDQGGSVRLPSSWTGCAGLKPTWGLVPVTGSIGMLHTHVCMWKQGI